MKKDARTKRIELSQKCKWHHSIRHRRGRPTMCIKRPTEHCHTYLCSAFITGCKQYWEELERERKEAEKLRSENSVEVCKRMIRDEKRQGLKGRCAGRYAIWFPRHPRTNNLLPPPADAVGWDFFAHRWVLSDEIGPDTDLSKLT